MERCLAYEPDSAEILVGRGSRISADVYGELSLEQFTHCWTETRAEPVNCAYNGGISAVARPPSTEIIRLVTGFPFNVAPNTGSLFRWYRFTG